MRSSLGSALVYDECHVAMRSEHDFRPMYLVIQSRFLKLSKFRHLSPLGELLVSANQQSRRF